MWWHRRGGPSRGCRLGGLDGAATCGRSARLHMESWAAAAETSSRALVAMQSWTKSAVEKCSIARRVVDENLLQTPTRQRNRMSSSLNTYL